MQKFNEIQKVYNEIVTSAISNEYNKFEEQTDIMPLVDKLHEMLIKYANEVKTEKKKEKKMINKNKTKRYCKDDISKIENYDKAVADETQTWDCHHRLELTLDGEFANTRKDLKRLKMYYKRPYFELIFLTRAEHNRIHGKGQSEESKTKWLEANKGRKLNEEHKKKISEAKRNKPHSDFGQKYFSHFGYSRYENLKQYAREKNWYYRHNNKCSWEE